MFLWCSFRYVAWHNLIQDSWVTYTRNPLAHCSPSILSYITQETFSLAHHQNQLSAVISTTSQLPTSGEYFHVCVFWDWEKDVLQGWASSQAVATLPGTDIISYQHPLSKPQCLQPHCCPEKHFLTDYNHLAHLYISSLIKSAYMPSSLLKGVRHPYKTKLPRYQCCRKSYHFQHDHAYLRGKPKVFCVSRI